MFVGTPLTQQEWKVAQCVAKGMNVKTTMAAMQAPSHTVKTLRRNLLRKTNARTVAQFACWMHCELFLKGLLVYTSR